MSDVDWVFKRWFGVGCHPLVWAVCSFI